MSSSPTPWGQPNWQNLPNPKAQRQAAKAMNFAWAYGMGRDRYEAMLMETGQGYFTQVDPDTHAFYRCPSCHQVFVRPINPELRCTMGRCKNKEPIPELPEQDLLWVSYKLGGWEGMMDVAREHVGCCGEDHFHYQPGSPHEDPINVEEPLAELERKILAVMQEEFSAYPHKARDDTVDAYLYGLSNVGSVV